MHNAVKWPNMLLKSCGVHTARFLKCVWPFYNIMHERVKTLVWKKGFPVIEQMIETKLKEQSLVAHSIVYGGWSIKRRWYSDSGHNSENALSCENSGDLLKQ